MPRWLRHCLVPPLLLPTLSWAAPAREGPEANIRPCFNTGYTSPGGLPRHDDGFGLGAAFEAEHARAVSLLFRVEWDLLTSTRSSPYYLSIHNELVYLTWSIGVRGYLRSGATLRPYGEVDIGVRMGGEDPDAQGVTCVPRIGIAWAHPGGAGLLLEAGANFTTRDPESSLIVPIRVGIIFP
jgi:hypothetical protein